VRRREVGVALAVACALGACTSLLGDFSIGDAGSDASPEAGLDAPQETGFDAPPDAPKDSPPEGPSCGHKTELCCQGTQCNAGLSCCGNTCVDTTNDDANCGSCGRKCAGQGCTNSACNAKELTSFTDKAPGRVRLDATTVYFITVNQSGNGALYSCPKSGCGAPTTLFSGVGYAADLVLDSSGYAYVSDFNNNNLLQCAVGGCGGTPSVVGVSGSSFNGLDFRSGWLFAVYASPNSPGPHQLHTDGTNPLDLGDGNEGAGWIVAPPGLYEVFWTKYDRIREGLEGSPDSGTDYYTPTDQLGLLDGNGNYVVWNEVGNTGNSTVYSCGAYPIPCNSLTKLATTGRMGYLQGGLFIDPNNDVYWASLDSNGTHVLVSKCSASGGCGNNPMTLGAVAASNPFVGGIAVDGQNVFFTVGDGSKVRLYVVPK
jgi:hypothetical protein